MTTREERNEPRDELDEMAGVLRDVLRAGAASETVDWDRVQRMREDRARRRRVAFVAGGIAALAATLAAVFVLPRMLASDGAGVARGRVAPSQAGVSRSPGTDAVARRVLRDDGDTRIVAEVPTQVRADESGDLRLDAGRVWLRVHRSTEGAPRPGAPLCVRTPDLRACVHGTAFEVAALTDGTTVTVAEGMVRVERPGFAALVVPAGHRIAPPYSAVEHAAPAAIVAVAEALGLDAVALAPAPEVVATIGPAETPSARGIPAPVPARLADPGLQPPTAPAGQAHVVLPPARPTHVASQAAVDAGPGVAGDAGPTPAAPDFEAVYRAADRALKEGRSAEALELLERIAGAAPGTIVGGQALIDIGQTHLRAGRPAEARRAFVRYLAEQPTGAMRELARMSICRIEAGAGRFAEAATCYSTYLTEFPAGAFVDEARRATGQGTVSEESRTEP